MESHAAYTKEKEVTNMYMVQLLSIRLLFKPVFITSGSFALAVFSASHNQPLSCKCLLCLFLVGIAFHLPPFPLSMSDVVQK